MNFDGRLQHFIPKVQCGHDFIIRTFAFHLYCKDVHRIIFLICANLACSYGIRPVPVSVECPGSDCGFLILSLIGNQ